MDAAALLRRAVESERVAFVPGSAFSVDGRAGRHALRLNFTNQGVAEIEEAVERLGRAVRAAARLARLAGSGER